MEEQLKENEPAQNHDKSDQGDIEQSPDTAQTAEVNDVQATTEGPARHKHGKLIIVAVVVLVVLAGGIYGGIGVYYKSHFLPNTIVNGIDVSGMEAAQAAEVLDARIQGYVLEVTGRDSATGVSGVVLGMITPGDIQLTFADTLGSVENIMGQQEWLLWIKSFIGQGNVHNLEQSIAFNEAQAESLVKSWDASQKQNMVAAKNAYISEYSEALHGYEVIPETTGTELDVEQAVVLVKEALQNSDTKLDLEEAGLYVEAEILKDDSSLRDPVETANRLLSTVITYDWNGNEVVLDAETLWEWVTIQDGEVFLDEEAVSAFVKAQSRKYDTYGKYKDFVTTQGVTLTLPSPSYGWRTDTAAETEALIQLIQEGATGTREPVYTHQGMIKGANDIGNSYVEADLTSQHLYLYQDGEVVLETDFVSGKISNGNGTPAGIFGITYKTTNAVLRGENYETPVNYWMPFYGNYGMHDATWRRAFGGDIYLNNGSHGCINLPKAKAEQIYAYISTGFPVICYYYEAPVAPEGPELPDPETEAPETDPSEEIPEGTPEGQSVSEQ